MADPIHYITTPTALRELFNSTTYVLIDFTATWCGPCKTIAPVFTSLAKKHHIPGILAFAKVDVDEAQAVAREYGVSAMPTFLAFKDGKLVGVNGMSAVRGADVKGLTAAVEKLSGLARKREAERKG